MNSHPGGVRQTSNHTQYFQTDMNTHAITITVFLLAILVAPMLVGQPSPNQPSGTFTQALMVEEHELDPQRAADLYTEVIELFDTSRERAANSIFRLAECLQKMGETEEAKSQYSRILREFADQHELVRLSQTALSDPVSRGKGEEEIYIIDLSSTEAEICFQDEPVDMMALEEQLVRVKGNEPEALIHIVSDENTSRKRVVAILDLFKEIGIKKVAMRVDQLTNQTKPIERQPEMLRFKVLGRVQNPGLYEVPSDMDLDLLDALAIAGGYIDNARNMMLNKADGSGQLFQIHELARNSEIPKLAGDETITVYDSFE